MKKIILLLANVCLLTLFSTLAGCSTDENNTLSSYDAGKMASSPLRVLFDVEFGSNLYLKLEDELATYKVESVEGVKKRLSFQAMVKEMGGPSSIKIEIPPVQGNEREMYLTNLRTEIMAGGGPDVFVCGSGIGYHMDEKTGEYIKSEPLLRYPQQAMKRNMFLALDEYIGGAKFMEWQKLTPVIMDAGKTEKGQFLLPMTYTVPTTAFRKEDVNHTPSKDMTWEDMLSQGPHIQLAAIQERAYPGNGLAPLADYQHDKLAISEEEMIQYFSEKLDNLERCKEESGVPYTRFDLKVRSSYDLSFYDDRFREEDPIVLVPLYSRSGGCTATVKSFVGINVNTKHPDDAFFVVDYLLGEECQRSKIYAFMTINQAVPTLEGLMTHGTSVSDAVKTTVMPDDLYKQFCLVRDSISFADFATPLDHELQRLYIDELLEPSKESAKSRESIIHDAYMRMSMDLAES